MKIYRAGYESRNFSFQAYGLSEKEALDALYMGLAAHRELYDLAEDWYYKGDIYVTDYNIGSAYRDTTEIYGEDLAWRVRIMIDNKVVDAGSIVVDGIDIEDHPDYTEAYVRSAEYEDGSALDEDALAKLKLQYSDLIYDKVVDTITMGYEPQYKD